MKKMKKSRSYDQYQLKELSDLVCDDIENLLLTFQIEDYKIFDKMIVMPCPIHGGDNNSAFNLYHQGDTYRGNWKCRTHQCEETFKSSIIGFIRGCLSKSRFNWSQPGDKLVSFDEALDFAIKFTNHDLSNTKIPKKEKEKHNFVSTVNCIKTTPTVTKNAVSRAKVQSSLSIPSNYFIARGYQPQTLIKYDVGDCIAQGRPMYNRAVVPVYDLDHKNMVGCSGRAIGDCLPKWKHNDGFKAEEHLYNYWYAKDHIKNTGIVIVVS